MRFPLTAESAKVKRSWIQGLSKGGDLSKYLSLPVDSFDKKKNSQLTSFLVEASVNNYDLLEDKADLGNSPSSFSFVCCWALLSPNEFHDFSNLSLF